VTIQDCGPVSAVACLCEHVRTTRFHEQRAKSAQPLWPIVSTQDQVMWKSPIAKGLFVGYMRTILQKAGYGSSQYSGRGFRSGGVAVPAPFNYSVDGRSDAFCLCIRDNPQFTAEEVVDAVAFFTVAGCGSSASLASPSDSRAPPVWL